MITVASPTPPQALPEGLTFFQRGWLSSNNVLLHDEEQAWLIDTGYWTHSAQTLGLVQAALGAQALTTIVNTHLHSDHCGGNASLQAAFPSVHTLIPPGHASHVFDWDPAALTFEPTGQHCPKFQASGLIEPGFSFRVADHTWCACAAPGHDPHSIILFCEDTGTLISADALWENGFGVVFPEIEGIAAFDEVSQTLDLIESLKPAWVLPGHGAAFQSVPAALAQARRRLDGFQRHPEKHASYAAKVLLKFKLLELQSVSFVDFNRWAEKCDFLCQLHQRFAPQLALEEWLHKLGSELEASGAARRIENQWVNV